MRLILAASILISGVSAQEPPKPAQFVLKIATYTSPDDLWLEVREVDAGFKALGADVEKLARDFESESIEVRNKAAAAVQALGLSAYGAIRDVRDATTSAAVRTELDAVLKKLSGDLPGRPKVLPAQHALSAEQAGALAKRFGDKGARRTHMPSIALRENSSGNIFVGDEIPVGPRKRLKLTPGGEALKLTEDRPAAPGAGPVPAGGLKFGFSMLVHAATADPARQTVRFTIGVTNTHIVRPIRERETPLGTVSDPEVIELGIDLAPVLEPGRHLVAGPFPSADPKGEPWWIVIEWEAIR